jgi:limonene-1,2-epoxide hydrolase
MIAEASRGSAPWPETHPWEVGMIELEVASNDDERLALRVLMAIEDGDFATELSNLCTQDFVWANSGLPTLCGRTEVLELMAKGGFASELPLLADMTHFSVDLLHIASRTSARGRNAVVFTERIDHHWAASGADLMAPHIAGVMEICDGRVAALRDFYDTACYAQEPTAADPVFALEAFRERTRARGGAGRQ